MSPEQHIDQALVALGYRESSETDRTGERFAELLRELLPGDKPTLSVFPVRNPGPVVLRDLPFHALCAHHLLPFFGTATIAYMPQDDVGGFSGIARLLHHHSRGPQLQERIATELADSLMTSLQAKGVQVRLVARQMCMEMRGSKTPGTIVTFASRGEDCGLGLLLGKSA